jgi:hypothetical protein
MAYPERHGLQLQGTEMVDIGSWKVKASHTISIRLSPLHIHVDRLGRSNKILSRAAALPSRVRPVGFVLRLTSRGASTLSPCQAAFDIISCRRRRTTVSESGYSWQKVARGSSRLITSRAIVGTTWGMNLRGLAKGTATEIRRVVNFQLSGVPIFWVHYSQKSPTQRGKEHKGTSRSGTNGVSRFSPFSFFVFFLCVLCAFA